MNRGQIRDLARKSLGETTAAFWTDAELNLYLNVAGHDIADKTKNVKTNSYFTSVLNQSEYSTTLLTNCLSIQEIYFKTGGTTWTKLEPTDRTTMDNENDGWLSAASGTPIKYIEDMEQKIITFYPAPDAANAGASYVRVFYSTDFTELTSDSATPTDMPIDLQLAMADFICAYGYQQRGWGDKSNDAWSKYFNRLKEYMIERGREQEDRDIVMKPSRR